MLNSSAKKKCYCLYFIDINSRARRVSIRKDYCVRLPAELVSCHFHKLHERKIVSANPIKICNQISSNHSFLNNQLCLTKKPFKHIIVEVLTFFGLTFYNKIGCNQIQNPTRVQSLPNIWLVFLIHCMFVKREFTEKRKWVDFQCWNHFTSDVKMLFLHNKYTTTLFGVLWVFIE